MTKVKLTHKLAAAFVTGILMTQSAEAYAQGIDAITDNVRSSIGTLPQLLAAVAYLGGAGLTIAGLFKLKAHVDNPTQTTLKDPLGRLGVGAGLLATPFVAESLLGTVGEGGGVGFENIESGLGTF